MVLPSPKFAFAILLIAIGFLTKFQIKIELSDQKDNF